MFFKKIFCMPPEKFSKGIEYFSGGEERVRPLPVRNAPRKAFVWSFALLRKILYRSKGAWRAAKTI